MPAFSNLRFQVARGILTLLPLSFVADLGANEHQEAIYPTPENCRRRTSVESYPELCRSLVFDQDFDFTQEVHIPPRIAAPALDSREASSPRISARAHQRKIASLEGEVVEFARRPVEPSRDTATHEAASEFKGRLRFGYLKLASLDIVNQGEALLLSDLNMGLDTSWEQNWSESMSSEFRFGLNRINIMQNADLSVGNASGTYSELEGALFWNMGRKWELGISVGLGQNIFCRSVNGDDVQLEKIFLPAVSLELKKTWSFSNRLSLGLGLRGGVLLSSATDNYRTQVGGSYSAQIEIGHQLKFMHLLGTGFVRSLTYDSDIATQRVLETGLSMGIGLPF